MAIWLIGADAMHNSEGKGKKSLPVGMELKKLSLDQIKRIDALMATLGDYGEIHLVVHNGELRYINKLESYRARKDDDDKVGQE